MKLEVENIKYDIESVAAQLEALNFIPFITILSDHDYNIMVLNGIIKPDDPKILPFSRMNEFTPVP